MEQILENEIKINFEMENKLDDLFENEDKWI